MENCKFCEIDKEFGGEYFAMHHFSKISEDANIALETMIGTYLRIRKLDGNHCITVSVPYETDEGKSLIGVAGKEINYCPFCGRKLGEDAES